MPPVPVNPTSAPLGPSSPLAAARAAASRTAAASSAISVNLRVARLCETAATEGYASQAWGQSSARRPAGAACGAGDITAGAPRGAMPLTGAYVPSG